MSTIPAGKLVSAIPGVLSAGGSPLTLNSIFGTLSIRVPLGVIMSFPSAQSVSDFFGANSIEAQMANTYFQGYTNATRIPSALYFAQYNNAPVAGYLRSGSFKSVTLAQLQALSGSLTVSVDGVSHVSAAINLATATSFSNAAALITAGLAAGTPTTAAVCTFDAQLQEFVITSSTTGVTSTLAFATNTLAVGLLFTQATGAVLSPGAAANTPAAFVSFLKTTTQNWAGFTTTFDPDNGASGGPVKVAFAQAIDAISTAGKERFFYAAEDTDILLTEGAAPTSFPVLTEALNGRVAIYTPASGGPMPYGLKAAFVCGTVAAINWAQRNGRITLAYKSNATLTPDVTDETVSDNLDLNGVNYYGAFATAAQTFQLFQEGQISGPWDWIDPYVNQIYLNSQFQLAFMVYLSTVGAVPYNDPGYGQLRGVMRGPINEATNNGSIVAGVALSPAQVQALIVAAGLDISGPLFQQGWYLQILDPGSVVRGQRGSPVINFWYTDGGAIQKIVISSTDVQ